jgi:hypothetical protein
MLNVFACLMLAPPRASDPAILEMATGSTLSLHHQTTPASPESEKGAFVHGKLSPRLAAGALFHMVTVIGFVWDCSMPPAARQMYVHPNSAAIFPSERVF